MEKYGMVISGDEDSTTIHSSVSMTGLQALQDGVTLLKEALELFRAQADEQWRDIKKAIENLPKECEGHLRKQIKVL